jgi:hypothetical protein
VARDAPPGEGIVGTAEVRLPLGGHGVRTTSRIAVETPEARTSTSTKMVGP